ncbi:hypothetical protein NEOLEDRAFT_1152258 [Neolentinus lepideus HHB14362 ss-1]|uniref:Uncharacterized protein n=1 Tax=Neolentinus lepideus HHB14362 ss-1 TaxID=1314782 RepID=A0A165MZ06_9AGAM|nr:hypothetical protein NEOLEDRAFT_1152258 [Neolentinus lepideus HHB14362 ss-1]
MLWFWNGNTISSHVRSLAMHSWCDANCPGHQYVHEPQDNCRCASQWTFQTKGIVPTVQDWQIHGPAFYHLEATSDGKKELVEQCVNALQLSGEEKAALIQHLRDGSCPTFLSLAFLLLPLFLCLLLPLFLHLLPPPLSVPVAPPLPAPVAPPHFVGQGSPGQATVSPPPAEPASPHFPELSMDSLMIEDPIVTASSTVPAGLAPLGKKNPSGPSSVVFVEIPGYVWPASDVPMVAGWITVESENRQEKDLIEKLQAEKPWIIHEFINNDPKLHVAIHMAGHPSNFRVEFLEWKVFCDIVCNHDKRQPEFKWLCTLDLILGGANLALDIRQVQFKCWLLDECKLYLLFIVYVIVKKDDIGLNKNSRLPCYLNGIQLLSSQVMVYSDPFQTLFCFDKLWLADMLQSVIHGLPYAFAQPQCVKLPSWNDLASKVKNGSIDLKNIVIKCTFSAFYDHVFMMDCGWVDTLWEVNTAILIENSPGPRVATKTAEMQDKDISFNSFDSYMSWGLGTEGYQTLLSEEECPPEDIRKMSPRQVDDYIKASKWHMVTWPGVNDKGPYLAIFTSYVLSCIEMDSPLYKQHLSLDKGPYQILGKKCGHKFLIWYNFIHLGLACTSGVSKLFGNHSKAAGSAQFALKLSKPALMAKNGYLTAPISINVSARRVNEIEPEGLEHLAKCQH